MMLAFGIGAAERDRHPPRHRRRPRRASSGNCSMQGLLLSLAGGALGLVAAIVGRAGCWCRRWRPCCRSRSRSTLRPTPRRAGDADLLHAGDHRIRAVAGAAAVAPGSAVVAQGSGRRESAAGSAGRITVRGALVTAQLALSLALLVLSGLFVRGAAAGASADPGFALDPLVVAQIEPKLGGYDAVQQPRGAARVLERLRAHAGHRSGRGRVGRAVRRLLVSAPRCSARAAAEERGPRGARQDRLRPSHTRSTSDYFRTLGLTMVRAASSRRPKRPTSAARRR